MKIIVIGDVHGHDSWKRVLARENNEFDKIVFLGDYLDGFNTSKEKIRENFYEILKFKEEQGDKCILLLGNHDWHYVSFGERYSGWSNDTFRWANLAVKDCLENETIKILHREDDILFTHAGITKTWMRYWFESDNPNKLQFINYKDLSPKVLNFTYGDSFSEYGDTVYSSPIWVRPASLLKDKIDGFKQVVGHTMMNTLANQDEVWFCDTMPREYLVIEDNKFIIKNLN